MGDAPFSIMKKVERPGIIAWFQFGNGRIVPRECKLENRSGRAYLVYQVGARQSRSRQRIDPKLLLKLAPDQWGWADYLYSKPIKLSSTSAAPR